MHAHRRFHGVTVVGLEEDRLPRVAASGDRTPFRWAPHWVLTNTLLSGLFALAWLILRSAPKPSRFTYPCQRAAFATASLAFGAPLVSALLTFRGGALAVVHSRAGIALIAVLAFIGAGAWAYGARGASAPVPIRAAAPTYRAQVYHVTDCPQDPRGDKFDGLDKLLVHMGRGGLKFYNSPHVTPLAGPEGIIAANDVVIIKINYQWDQRGGTNTDLLRGLIRRLIDHPDTFTGEIVVCENSQFADLQNFDRANNNAQNHAQSPHDVVVDYQGRGVRITHYSWTDIRYTSRSEYSAGDLNDGYIVLAYDNTLQGRPSYPKFRTGLGTYISLRYGIWDQVSRTYDRDRLKVINVPVLKTHSGYGVTAAIKHYMGVVTRELSTNSHSAIARGMLGAVMGIVRPPDLNILDCIWINAHPGRGPSTSYADALRMDMLVASRDPVAMDRWAVKNVLIPGFVKNGYQPPWGSADPDNSSSTFRRYLDASMKYILNAGFETTNDPNFTDAYSWSGLADVNCDGAVDFADIYPFVLALAGAAGYEQQYPYCVWMNADCNKDGHVDFGDINAFVELLGG